MNGRLRSEWTRVIQTHSHVFWPMQLTIHVPKDVEQNTQGTHQWMPRGSLFGRCPHLHKGSTRTLLIGPSSTYKTSGTPPLPERFKVFLQRKRDLVPRAYSWQRHHKDRSHKDWGCQRMSHSQDKERTPGIHQFSQLLLMLYQRLLKDHTSSTSAHRKQTLHLGKGTTESLCTVKAGTMFQTGSPPTKWWWTLQDWDRLLTVCHGWHSITAYQREVGANHLLLAIPDRSWTELWNSWPRNVGYHGSSRGLEAIPLRGQTQGWGLERSSQPHILQAGKQTQPTTSQVEHGVTVIRYNLLLVHKPGALMKKVDILSRPVQLEDGDQDNLQVTLLLEKMFSKGCSGFWTNPSKPGSGWG